MDSTGRAAVIAALGVLAQLAACGNPSSTSGGDDDDTPAPMLARVDVYAGLLTPDHVRVRVGGTVHWYNMDNTTHRLVSGTANGGDIGAVFDSDAILGGAFQPFTSFSVSFASEGETPYFCSIHTETLVGSVRVSGP